MCACECTFYFLYEVIKNLLINLACFEENVCMHALLKIFLTKLWVEQKKNIKKLCSMTSFLYNLNLEWIILMFALFTRHFVFFIHKQLSFVSVGLRCKRLRNNVKVQFPFRATPNRCKQTHCISLHIIHCINVLNFPCVNKFYCFT